jgi:hypothetical protein
MERLAMVRIRGEYTAQMIGARLGLVLLTIQCWWANFWYGLLLCAMDGATTAECHARGVPADGTAWLDVRVDMMLRLAGEIGTVLVATDDEVEYYEEAPDLDNLIDLRERIERMG